MVRQLQKVNEVNTVRIATANKSVWYLRAAVLPAGMWNETFSIPPTSTFLVSFSASDLSLSLAPLIQAPAPPLPDH